MARSSMHDSPLASLNLMTERASDDADEIVAGEQPTCSAIVGVEHRSGRFIRGATFGFKEKFRIVVM